MNYHFLMAQNSQSKAEQCLTGSQLAIQSRLLHIHIKFPEGDDLNTVMDGLERKWRFPRCAGAVDGTHIPIIAPQENHVDYFNQKGWYSIVMQAVVDDNYCFGDAYIQWPGGVHDARILRNSKLFKKATSGTLFLNQTTDKGVSIPPLILGDPAYPLLSWLMKPFPHHSQLTRDQRRFDYRLSHARMTVENAFGQLKGRWRRLLKRLDVKTDDMPMLVVACCILNNICKIHHNEFSSEWIDSSDMQQPNLSTTDENEDGISSESVIRRALVSHFTH